MMVPKIDPAIAPPHDDDDDDDDASGDDDGDGNVSAIVSILSKCQ